MRADEMRDAGSLTGTALADVAVLAEQVHRAVSVRVFGLAGRGTRLGWAVAPVRRLHDGIAGLAYASARFGVRYGPSALALVAGARADPAAGSAHDTRRGRAVLGAVNGCWGDQVADRQSALAPQLRLRLHDGPLRRVPGDLIADAQAAGTVTGRLVVLIHGLCQTDLCWSFAAQQRWDDRTCTYGSRLRDDDGWTPLYAHYNTGLRVSANGLELAGRLEQLVAHWPVEVTEVALVGHSLGGLVARSAAHQGDVHGHRWVRTLRHVVGLGTPHLGAPLERATNWGTHHLARLPETRPFATWLNRRSVGIKDLRYGALLEADWAGHDPDELLTDRCTPAALLPGVSYSVASATLSRGPAGLFATDLLVAHRSAHGIGKVRTIGFEADRTFHLGGRKTHFDLLADRQVYDVVRAWLAAPTAPATPSSHRPERPD